jgi:hypothetical protein
MSLLNKTSQSTDLFPVNVVLADTVDVNGNQGVTDTKIQGGLAVSFAPVSTQATPCASEWIIWKKITSAGMWRPYIGRLTDNTQAASTTIAAGGTSGSRTATFNSVGSFSVGQWVFLKNGTIGNSEWAKIADIAGSVVTFYHNLINTQSAATVWNKGEVWIVEVPFETFKEGIMVTLSCSRSAIVSGTDRDCAFQVKWTTLDSVENS